MEIKSTVQKPERLYVKVYKASQMMKANEPLFDKFGVETCKVAYYQNSETFVILNENVPSELRNLRKVPVFYAGGLPSKDCQNFNLGAFVLFQPRSEIKFYGMMKRSANSKVMPNLLAPVGGYVMKNESPQQAAVREVAEEIGVIIKPSSLELTAIFISVPEKAPLHTIMMIYSYRPNLVWVPKDQEWVQKMLVSSVYQSFGTQIVNTEWEEDSKKQTVKLIPDYQFVTDEDGNPRGVNEKEVAWFGYLHEEQITELLLKAEKQMTPNMIAFFKYVLDMDI